MTAGALIFRWMAAAPGAIAGSFFGWTLVAGSSPAAGAQTAADGAGVTNRGPSLLHEGRAAADFALRTGRMPLADSHTQPSRGPVRFDEEQIRALVDYVGELGDGPDIPDINAAAIQRKMSAPAVIARPRW